MNKDALNEIERKIQFYKEMIARGIYSDAKRPDESFDDAKLVARNFSYFKELELWTYIKWKVIG